MSYSKIYRGEFANALSNENNETVEQIVRVDISDTSGGSSDIASVTGSIVIGFGAVAFKLVAATEDDYNDFVDFFKLGMAIRVSGTPDSDGDYIIASEPVFSPPTPLPTLGYVDFDLNMVAPGGSVGFSPATVENITVTEIIPLDMDGDPIHILTIDDAEDKFTPIRGKQAEIKVQTSSSINVDTFCDGDDEKYYVEIFIDDLIIFRGFLIIPDMEQDFLPDPNVLKLTAVDNLGTLRDQALVDADNEYPIGKFKLIEYIRWGLKKTGIIQNINVVNNIKHGAGIFTATASFVASTKQIILSDAYANKFYPGMVVAISGTASNNGDYTIRSVAVENILGFDFAIVFVSESLVDESNVNTTFTDPTSTLHFLEAICLDAKTFEKQIGLGEDFYTVVTKILGEDSVLFQCKGEWYIIRIDEIENFEGVFQMDVAVFNSDGVYQSHAMKTFAKAVGVDDRETFSDDNAVIIPDRAYKFAKETFKYETPAEIICNLDFSRGDFIEDIDPTEEEKTDGATSAKKYELDDWTLMRGYPEAPGSPIANDSTVFIKRLFNVVDYESSRYVTMTPPSSPNEASPYILSCPLSVKKFDRFEASVNLRLPSNPTNNFFAPILQFAVFGKDGNWYLLTISDENNGTDSIGPRWVDTNGWTVNTALGDYHLLFAGTGATGALDYTQDQIISFGFKDVPPIPVDGDLYIFIHGLNVSDETSTDDIDVYYTNLSFTYYPFINGSYQKYTGQYHMVSQNTKNKAARDNQVYMSDSPRMLFKGAMLIFNGTDYVLAGLFTDHNHSVAKPYGEIQTYAVWNQYKSSSRNFDGNVDFLDSDTTLDSKYDGIDLLHKVDLTDIDPNTANRYFLILHYDQDLFLLAMKAFIASLYRIDLGKVYTDPHEFKYITE